MRKCLRIRVVARVLRFAGEQGGPQPGYDSLGFSMNFLKRSFRGHVV